MPSIAHPARTNDCRFGGRQRGFWRTAGSGRVALGLLGSLLAISLAGYVQFDSPLRGQLESQAIAADRAAGGGDASAESGGHIASGRHSNQPRITDDNTVAWALQRKQFDRAVRLYENRYAVLPEEGSAIFRGSLLDHAAELIQREQSGDALALLESYLSVFYRDSDALTLAGMAYREEDRWMSAIRSYQQAHQHESRQAVRNMIQRNLNWSIHLHAQQLRESGEIGRVFELYRELIRLQPDYPGYRMALADQYTADQQFSRAIASLRYVQYDYQVGELARRKIHRIQQRLGE